MKAIQVSIDEELLHRLDADPEVQRDGRSAVLRRAVTAYLQQRRAQQIADAYRRGYGKAGGICSEFDYWESETDGAGL
jgi:metal-responsive CopG/Arc/MetJ family transcriptional regulator